MTRTPLLLLLLLLVAPSVWAGPAQPKADIQDIVPKTIQLSLGADHIFAATQLRVTPGDLGETSWASWDKDSSGSLSLPEQGPLLEFVRRRTLASQRVAVGGVLVDWDLFPVQRSAAAGEPLGLTEAIELKVSGRVSAGPWAGDLAFVVYAPPRGRDGIVPLRLSLAPDLSFVAAEGARAELRGSKRLEAVLTRASPALWGTLRSSP
jgi:hypothetical protein